MDPNLDEPHFRERLLNWSLSLPRLNVFLANLHSARCMSTAACLAFVVSSTINTAAHHVFQWRNLVDSSSKAPLKTVICTAFSFIPPIHSVPYRFVRFRVAWDLQGDVCQPFFSSLVLARQRACRVRCVTLLRQVSLFS